MTFKYFIYIYDYKIVSKFLQMYKNKMLYPNIEKLGKTFKHEWV